MTNLPIDYYILF
jgi:hypothetical protein